MYIVTDSAMEGIFKFLPILKSSKEIKEVHPEKYTEVQKIYVVGGSVFLNLEDAENYSKESGHTYDDVYEFVPSEEFYNLIFDYANGK